MQNSEKDIKKYDIAQAKVELAQIDYALELAKDNDFGCEVQVGGVKICICENLWIIPILKKERVEVEKFIAGKPNKYE
jgi:hypothetical protein